MKPLLILLLLLFALIISLVFRRFLPIGHTENFENNLTEGFISFANSANYNKKVYIPLYSNRDIGNTYKLYDSIFYDINNGYIIEVDSIKYSDNSDDKGLNVNGIYVVKRDGTYNSDIFRNQMKCGDAVSYGNIYAAGNVSADSCSIVASTQTTSYPSSLTTKYRAWSYNTNGSETDKYLVIYLCYDIITFIHIMNQSTQKHIITYSIVGSESIKYNAFNSNDKLTVSTAKVNKDINNNTYVLETLYDSKIKVYQFTDTVKFDDNNGYLIISNKDANTVTVYNRSGTVQKDFKGNLPVDMANYATQSKSWVVPDGNGSQVLYIPLGKITVLIEIIYEESLFKSRRTFITGSYNNDIFVDSSKTDGPSSSSYSSSSSSSNKVDLDKYILKTQIIPPVCPSCPKCPCYDGVCNECGGNGGSGTSSSEDRSAKIKRKLKNFFNNGRHTDEEEAIEDAEREERNQKIKGKIKNFFKEGRHTEAEEEAEDAERDERHDRIKSKLKNFFKNGRNDDESSDEEDLNGNVDLRTSGRWDDSYNYNRNSAIDDSYSQTSWGYKPSEREFREQEQNIQNTYNVPQTTAPSTVPGVDPYSYFGALVPKGGYDKYMPITADFSSFGL